MQSKWSGRGATKKTTNTHSALAYSTSTLPKV